MIQWRVSKTSRRKTISSSSDLSHHLIKNLKVSTDSAFSFWGIESKWKRGIGGISRKGQFWRRKSDQSTSFGRKSIVKSFNFENLAKIRERRDFLKHQRWLITRILGTVLFWQKNILSVILSKVYEISSVRSCSLMQISGTDWKTKNFREFCVFVLTL